MSAQPGRVTDEQLAADREMIRRGRDRTPWPRELMHAELCAWRFGANAKCDCGLAEALGGGS